MPYWQSLRTGLKTASGLCQLLRLRTPTGNTASRVGDTWQTSG